MIGRLSTFIKANVAAFAMVLCGAGVFTFSGCALPEIFNFQPRSAQAQGGRYSQTESFAANAKIADDAQRAAFISDTIGDVLPVGAPVAAGISRVLDEYGRTLAQQLERLDEESKTRDIKQDDILQSQFAALLAGLGGGLFYRRKQPTPAAV